MGNVLYLEKMAYRRLPIGVVGALFSLIRGLGTDLYLITKTDFRGRTEVLAKGRVTNKTLSQLTEEENLHSKEMGASLIAKLRQSTETIEDGKPIAYFTDENGYAAVVIDSDYGHLSFGWQDGAEISGPKNLLMTTLLAYAFGVVNADSSDQKMVTLLHNYLPFEGGMKSFSISEIDLVIGEAINNPPAWEKREAANYN